MEADIDKLELSGSFIHAFIQRTYPEGALYARGRVMI